ncbi:MAG: hypothetical protein A2Y62_20660 [Candidatus Fischerbacteria bacterium RBG_13_37_8]|uniref:DUF503 domain-containing protein n=1 Tax=Candidatus Fischerbacteria bacterium RBG_13_37_8 TaxID=1817863 RepID=A0A1F5VER3_9BACT|nr:MAG: hypothetical protein A2Y62_20660 [Candidatus Fischerbacteria bacterium RBG_13_37_8]
MSIIGYCSFDIHLPGCQSLKEKRMILLSIKQKLRKDFNVAVSELEYNDLWQRTLLGIVTVSNSQSTINGIFDKINIILEKNPAIEVVDHVRTFY